VDARSQPSCLIHNDDWFIYAAHHYYYLAFQPQWRAPNKNQPFFHNNKNIIMVVISLLLLFHYFVINSHIVSGLNHKTISSMPRTYSIAIVIYYKSSTAFLWFFEKSMLSVVACSLSQSPQSIREEINWLHGAFTCCCHRLAEMLWANNSNSLIITCEHSAYCCNCAIIVL
jgi:hypothetical protein